MIYKRMLVLKVRRISVMHRALSSWARESGECSEHNVALKEKQKFVTSESMLKSRLYSKSSAVSEEKTAKWKHNFIPGAITKGVRLAVWNFSSFLSFLLFLVQFCPQNSAHYISINVIPLWRCLQSLIHCQAVSNRLRLKFRDLFMNIVCSTSVH